jgi:cytochrome c-type biogenesis protein CcmH
VRSLAFVVVALALAGPAAAACSKPRASLESLEGQVMCPICHTTLDQSDSAVAERIKVYIRARIARCETSDQIKSELVADFGQSILAAPPRKGFDLLAWWLPVVGVVGGAVVLGIGVWRWSRGREPALATADPTTNGRVPLDPELERRVDEALARFEP